VSKLGIVIEFWKSSNMPTDGLLYERTEKVKGTNEAETTRYYYDGDVLIAEGLVQTDHSSVKKAE
jgi:hypothetical protein